MTGLSGVGGLIGGRQKRVEDARILTGQGRYIDDVVLPGMLHAAFLRSPHPHARIRGIDVTSATIRGVAAVFTGADILQATNPAVAEFPGGQPVKFYALATDKVRYVGDPVAVVVASSRRVAEDACDLIDVDYEPLPGIGSIAAALRNDAPPVFDEAGTNVIRGEVVTYGDVDAAFASADLVVKETFQQHRFAAVPMETRGGVAEYTSSTGELTYHSNCHGAHTMRVAVAALLNHPLHRFHVVVPDVGGSFGQKWITHREDVAVCFAAKSVGRPVKWVEDRYENLVAGGQAREESVEIAAAVAADGTVLGIRAEMTIDRGAYPGIGQDFPPMIGGLVQILLPSAYRISNWSFRVNIVSTNKATYVALRGPWATETWVRERLLDRVARELGLDPVALRHHNLYRLDEQPVKMITGPTLDGVTAVETLRVSTEVADYEKLREEQRRAREAGRLAGIGVATFIEAAPGPPDFWEALGQDLGAERSHVRVEPDGKVVVATSQIPHGQGHETTIAQVVADELGVPFDSIRVVHGDTRSTPFSMIGTGGSRAATMASGSVAQAALSVRRQVLDRAAHLLEVNASDLDLADGVVSVRGDPEVTIPLTQIAGTVYFAPGLFPPGTPGSIEAYGEFRSGAGGWVTATHLCCVEIDPGTGKVKITRYVVAEDCGVLINPAIVEGQIRGGVAQAIGSVLYERSAYDCDGQYLAATFMDYLVPTATEIPPIEIHHVDTRPTNRLDARGSGEGGAIAGPAAITNAIEDALAHLGVKVTEHHLSPNRILELIGTFTKESPTSCDLDANEPI